MWIAVRILSTPAAIFLDRGPMILSPEHLVGKPRIIGRSGTTPIYEVTTTGGFIMIVKGGSETETLGTGSHPAIARTVAEARDPKLVWTTLSKSDHVEYEVVAPLLPKYEALTEEIRAAEIAYQKSHRGK